MEIEINNVQSLETGEYYDVLFEKIFTGEKSFLKITKETLAVLLWQLGGIRAKVLALTINNLRETNNHVYFGKNDLIKYFIDTGQATRKSIEEAFNYLIRSHDSFSNEQNEFFKELGPHELMVNPIYINACGSCKYKDTRLDFAMCQNRQTSSKSKIIKSVHDIKSITSFKGGNSIGDIHVLHVYDMFFEFMLGLKSKKLIALAQLLARIKDDDRYLIIRRKDFQVNKSTMSQVTILLKEKAILKMLSPGAYEVNPKYISASSALKRNGRINEFMCTEKFPN